MNTTTNKAKNVNEEVNEQVNEQTNEQSTTVKKRRRGLGEVRGATRLKFTINDINTSNRLFLGHLDTVELNWSTQKEDSQLTSFAGLAVPYLVFTFASNVDKVNERKYITLRISPAESNALTIPGGKDEWKVNQPLNWLKHILDVFVLRGKQMPEEMEDMLVLPYEDFDENGEYVQVEAEEVIAGWRTLFENFLSILENNGKPYYKNEKGGVLPIWMKLLRYTKQKDKQTKEMVWVPVASGNQAGDFSFAAFVNEGCIELFNPNKAPLLFVDPSKESVTAKEVANKPKTPNMPQIPGSMPNTGVNMGNFNAMANPGMSDLNAADNYIPNAGSDDLPF